MYCENCGHENRESALFCAACGAVIPEPDDEKPADEITPYVNGTSYTGAVKSRQKRTDPAARDL